MADKKKVLGKGKIKVKDYPMVKKLELPKCSNESFSTDDFGIKKIKSPKLNGAQSSSDIGKRCVTPSPSGVSKRRFFNKRTSETPRREDFENKKKSVPNFQENSESYDVYIKALGSKLAKYKQKNFEVEEEIKQMEIRFKLEECNMRGEIEKLNNEIKKIKNDHFEEIASLNQEILRLRRENEENRLSYKMNSSQISEILESFPNPSVKERIELVLSEIFESFQETEPAQLKSSPNLMVSNCTASFNNIPMEVQSSREFIKSTQTQAIVLYDYNPTSHGELRLRSGDRVTILNSDENNGWWLGRIADKIGMFPRNCVMLD